MNERPKIEYAYPLVPILIPPAAPSAVVSAVSELQSACGSWTPATGKLDSQYSTQVAVCDVALGRHDAEHVSFITGVGFGIALLVLARVLNVWLLMLYRAAIANHTTRA